MHASLTRWLVATVLALSVAPLAAHHGWAGYQTAEFEIEGSGHRGRDLQRARTRR